MFDLIYMNNCVFVYDIEVWEALRKDYRIIGEFFGSTHYVPVLPLRLLPEEALLLIEKKVARLVTIDEKYPNPEEQKKFTEELLEAEKIYYKQLRLKEIENYIDKIIAGKRKKGDNRPKEEIIQSELDRLVITENKMIWPIMLHRHDKSTIKEVEKDVLLPKTSVVKYETFKDLWNKNYTVTDGTKFGGDFLIYEGDPTIYHSLYIVRCMYPNEELHATEIIAMGRVCTNVKKKGILSSFHDDSIHYITINWIEQ